MEGAVEFGRPWSGWSARTPLLRDDLLELGVDLPPHEALVGTISDAALWGIQYVLEGSKLGGQILSTRVAVGLPRRYLLAGQEKGAWSRFQMELEDASNEGDPDWQGLASAAARAMFERFEAALSIELRLTRER